MNIIRFGYKGEIFPIHLKLADVFGYTAYENISEVPKIPDLVIMALPPAVVPKVFEECGQKGVKRIVLISGGFREMQDERENDLSQKIQQIAEKYRMRFIGPNCLGLYNAWIYPDEEKAVFSMNIWEELERGGFSVVSQSGTLSSHIWFDPENLDLGLSKSFSIGNEADVDLVDILEYLKNDEETKVIGLYIEEIKRGKEFIKIAKEITKKKPIIAIYLGGSKAAERAISSHTGAIAGDSRIYDAVFKETGIIKTELVEEFLDLACFFSHGIIPKGKRLGILTNSGGPGAMIAHNAEKMGLKIPQLSPELQNLLKDNLIPTASVRNPVDATFDLNLPNYYVKLPEILLKSGEIDMLIIYGVFGLQAVLKNYLQHDSIKNHAQFPESNSNKNSSKDIAKLLITPIQQLSRSLSIPVIYINPQNFSSDWSKQLRNQGAMLFQLWDRPVRCLSKACEYMQYLKKTAEKAGIKTKI